MKEQGIGEVVVNEWSLKKKREERREEIIGVCKESSVLSIG
jgi:hypothetical protein